MEDNILDSGITARYKGKTFTLNATSDAAATRFNPARWAGLRTEPREQRNGGDKTIVMKFGEFQTKSGDEGYHGEEFTIDWGDGTSDIVKFDLYLTWAAWTPESGHGTAKQHPTRVPVHNHSVWINGKLQSDNSLAVEIVK